MIVLHHILLTLNTAWCLSDAQTVTEMTNEAMYKNCYDRCNIKTKKEPKTTLNKELLKLSRNLCENELKYAIERRLSYQGKISN